MQPGGQRPGLRPVHDDLGEPQRVLVVAQRALVQAGADVDALDPRFVGVAVQLHPVGDVTGAAVDADHFGDPGALGEVVVIGPVVVGLHVGAGPPAAAPVELHPALHTRATYPGRGSAVHRAQRGSIRAESVSLLPLIFGLEPRTSVRCSVTGRARERQRPASTGAV